MLPYCCTSDGTGCDYAFPVEPAGPTDVIVYNSAPIDATYTLEVH